MQGASGVFRSANRNEFEFFVLHAIGKIRHMDERDPMTARDQFPAERAEGMNVSRNRGADDREMQVNEGCGVRPRAILAQQQGCG